MKLTLRFFVGAFTLAVAALSLTLLVPKAAHAVAAAMVEVVNTAAAPAVVQDVSKLQSQNVLLWNPGAELIPHTAAALYQIALNGVTANSAFVVPTGQTLMITTVDFTYTGGQIWAGVGPEELALIPLSGVGTTQFQFTSGIAFPSGATVQISNYGLSSASIQAVFAHGYLTSN